MKIIHLFLCDGDASDSILAILSIIPTNIFFQTTDTLVDNVSITIMGNLTTPASQLNTNAHTVPMIFIVIFTIVWPIIITFGIFGNILSLAVLGKTDDSSTSSKFLTNLALVDTMTLIVGGIQLVFTLGEMFWPHQSWILSSFAMHMFSRWFDRISKGITVVIVADRLIAVVMPFRYKDIVRPVRVTIIIALIYIINSATTLPVIWSVFEYHIQTADDRTNGEVMGQRYFESVLSQSIPRAIHFTANIFLFDFIPIPIVFVCNVIIVVCLRKNNNKKTTVITDAQKERQRREWELTKLLLTISLLFLVLAGPHGIYIFLILIEAYEYTANPFMRKLVMDSLITLLFLNSSINFIIYAVMNKRYREGYISILCCCRRSNNIEDSPGAHSSEEEDQTPQRKKTIQ